MEAIFEDIVDAETLRQARRSYEENEISETPNEGPQLQYASCLVRCRSSVDITRGISLLNDLLERTDDQQTKRECLYYLAIGHTKQEKYQDALNCVEKLLRIEPWNRQFQKMKDCLDNKIGIDMLITGAKVMGGMAVAAAGIFGLGKLGQYLLSDKKKTTEPVPKQSYFPTAPSIDYSSSSEEEQDSVTDRLRGIHIGSECNQWQRSVAEYGICERECAEQLRKKTTEPVPKQSYFPTASSIAYSSSSEEEQDSVTDRLRGIHIGSEFNQWQRSVAEYGTCDGVWVEQLRSSVYIGEIDFGRKQWDRACRVVEKVKTLMLTEMRTRAESNYKGLKIDSYILQGSSRDGLKVIAPDEFDVGFEFHIEGIHLQERPIMKGASRVPGFCYLKVTDSPSTVEKKCPELWKKGIFKRHGDELYLSSKVLHKSVFVSLIDQSIQEVELKIKQKGEVGFKIRRKSNPPAVNITIELDDEANANFMKDGEKRKPTKYTNCIDVDIIPALRIKIDGESMCCGRMVNAPIHAICKWKEEESAKALEIADQNLVWLLNSVAYERFVFDVARNDEKQRYILTALRILKTYMTKVKTEKSPPPQIATVLQSYHLKQITCYLILYTCYVYPNIKIDDAQRALVFLVCLLEKCLEKGKLPHFFYSNLQIGEMFQNYPEVNFNTPLRFDMFRKISEESKRQALLSLRNGMKSDLGLSGNRRSYEDDLSTVRDAFSCEVDHGDYF